MPIEPPASPWTFPAPQRWPADDDLVAIGADLAPGTLLGAYRSGLFPMPLGRRRLGWFSPLRRGVLPLERLKVSRSLRRSSARFEIRIDSAFTDVITACARLPRDGGWIDDSVLAAYVALHELGWAHSVEAWRDGRLAGGLYGVAIGGLFAGESMFHVETDASKVALIGLVEAMSDRFSQHRLLDVQWLTPHLASLGVLEVHRATYLHRLAGALDLEPPGAFSPGAG